MEAQYINALGKTELHANIINTDKGDYDYSSGSTIYKYALMPPNQMPYPKLNLDTIIETPKYFN